VANLPRLNCDSLAKGRANVGGAQTVTANPVAVFNLLPPSGCQMGNRFRLVVKVKEHCLRPFVKPLLSDTVLRQQTKTVKVYCKQFLDSL
jgi:hypothetical protein